MTPAFVAVARDATPEAMGAIRDLVDQAEDEIGLTSHVVDEERRLLDTVCCLYQSSAQPHSSYGPWSSWPRPRSTVRASATRRWRPGCCTDRNVLAIR